MLGFPKEPDEQFKIYVYEQISRIGKALSSPARLIILNILNQGEHSVEALAKYSKLSVANLSQHLRMLKSANLVVGQRRGKYLYYRIADEQAGDFFSRVMEFAHQRLAEIDRVFHEISNSPSRLKPASINELKKKVNFENAVIVDVRPKEEYEQAHIPGAISIPLEELKERIHELPRDKTIVVFCRGRFCILADKAVELLIKKGFKARRIEDGIVEWKKAGLPVEKGDTF